MGGVDNDDEGLNVHEGIADILKDVSFNMRKWQTNSIALQKQFNERENFLSSCFRKNLHDDLVNPPPSDAVIYDRSLFDFFASMAGNFPAILMILFTIKATLLCVFYKLLILRHGGLLYLRESFF